LRGKEHAERYSKMMRMRTNCSSRFLQILKRFDGIQMILIGFIDVD
jgi:hypothetical protein